PLQVRFGLVGDVADLGGAGVAVALLDVAVAALPAADAVEEVAGVRRGTVALPPRLPRLDARPGARAVAALQGAVDGSARRDLVGRQAVGHHLVAAALDVER